MDEQPGFVVEGARIALGPLRMDLVATYQRWENDLEVANANGRVIPVTLEAERERIAGRSGKPECCDFTVYDRADQAPIGWSSLFHIDHRNGSAQFGIDLGERRGQGLGTEATRLTLDWGFSVLGLHNIMLAVAAWNERAIRVYTKVGFRELGRRRGAGLTMGRRHDGVFMDLLASEFLQAGGSVLAGRAPHGAPPSEQVGGRPLRRSRSVMPAPLLTNSRPVLRAAGRTAEGLPIPFIRQQLVDGPIAAGPWSFRGPALALLADIVIVAVGLWLVGGLWDRHRRRSRSNDLVEPGRPTA